MRAKKVGVRDGPFGAKAQLYHMIGGIFVSHSCGSCCRSGGCSTYNISR